MGFTSGTVTFRRYAVSGPHPERIDEYLVERLRNHAFGMAERATKEQVEYGWLSPTHLFDVDITERKVSAGDMLHVVMRLDKLAAPAAVLRSYRQMEESAAREASGADRLSTEERRKAKEAAEARAEKEARQGRYRRISSHHMVFDLKRHVVYFGSTGNDVHDKLRLLFANTFGATLIPLDAAELASQITGEQGRHRAFEDARAVHLIEAPVKGANGNGSMDGADRSFLGREFLSWLWHRAEVSEGLVPVSANGRSALPAEVDVMVDRMVQLDCDFHLTGRDVIYNDDPAGAPEARSALAVGKQPVKMGLTISAGGEQYRFVLDAAKWQISGLTLPESEEPDPRIRLEERLAGVSRCCDTLDGMFAAFLAERFGGSFRSLLSRMRRWAADPSAERTQGLRVVHEA